MGCTTRIWNDKELGYTTKWIGIIFRGSLMMINKHETLSFQRNFNGSQLVFSISGSRTCLHHRTAPHRTINKCRVNTLSLGSIMHDNQFACLTLSFPFLNYWILFREIIYRCERHTNRIRKQSRSDWRRCRSLDCVCIIFLLLFGYEKPMEFFRLFASTQS